MKQREHGKRDASLLAQEMYSWWLKKFQHVGNPTRTEPDRGVKIELEGKEKNVVLLGYQGVRLAMGFEPLGTYTGLTFFVQTNVPGKNLLENIQAKLKSFSGSGDGRMFSRIFDKPVVGYGNYKSGEYSYEGVHVSAKIRQVPQGSEGGLSDNLFVYAQRGIVGLIHEALSE